MLIIYINGRHLGAQAFISARFPHAKFGTDEGLCVETSASYTNHQHLRGLHKRELLCERSPRLHNRFCLYNAALEIGQAQLRRKIGKINAACIIINFSCCRASLYIIHRILVVCLHVAPRVHVLGLPQCWHNLHVPSPIYRH